MKLKLGIVIACLFLLSETLIAQSQVRIDWKESAVEVFETGKTIDHLTFEEAVFPKEQLVPYYKGDVKLQNGTLSRAEITNEVYKALSASQSQLLPDDFVNGLSSEFVIEWNSYGERNNNVHAFLINPFRKRNGQVQRLESCSVKIETNDNRTKRNEGFVSQSILQSGDWLKVAVGRSGVYVLSGGELSAAGASLGSIDPRTVKVYGHMGRQQDYLNQNYRHDDLVEMPVLFEGEDDGQLGSGDKIYFYAQGCEDSYYDTTSRKMDYYINGYADSAYYFITWGGANGKRITTVSNAGGSPEKIFDAFDEIIHYEKDLVNLLSSGSDWYGEEFEFAESGSIKPEKEFSFTLPERADDSLSYSIQVVGRSFASSNENYFEVTLNGLKDSVFIPGVSTEYWRTYARKRAKTSEVEIAGSNLTLNLLFSKPLTDSKGWLDYVRFNYLRKLNYSGDQLRFQTLEQRDIEGTTGFKIDGDLSRVTCWDITDHLSPRSYDLSPDNISYQLSVPGNEMNRFVLFSSADAYPVGKITSVSNQNLHGMEMNNMIIVTHPLFRAMADDLAEYHRTNDGMKVVVVEPQEIYNEFSGGKQDPIAIRAFARSQYDKNTSSDSLRYLLLFGDGSYDNKDRITDNENFIPTYQSANSLDPVGSFVSDDFYAFMDPLEGDLDNFNSLVALDLGIGRLPVRNQDEARGVVAKIKNYNMKSSNLNLNWSDLTGQEDYGQYGEWRNKMVFIADDEDSDTHVSQSDLLANFADTSFNRFNIDKIYLDAFVQQNSSSGESYPDAARRVVDAVQNGALLVNYTGHGGETGWAEEGILKIKDVQNWTNIDHLPLFFTATCEFSRFDLAGEITAGEWVLLNPNGGGIGLFTTVRLVFSSPNFQLNWAYLKVLKRMMKNGEELRLGDLFYKTKNEAQVNNNNLNFTLLGDPALKLVVPDFDVKTETINGEPVAESDTAKALSRMAITGKVTDFLGGDKNDFEGIVYYTIYDKYTQVRTLENDASSNGYVFQVQNNVLFKGKTKVTNGKFNFEFIVPKDIVYSYGPGKISYYAVAEGGDASGYSRDLTIGGSSDELVDDNTGPNIELFLNDENFVFGGTTDENPVLLAELWDSTGINTSGIGLGHDLIAILDDNVQNSILLNNYYESELGTFNQGKVRYKFNEGLEKGKHTLKLKAWDINNNSSTAYLEFEVASSADIALNNVLNYPNPFTSNTSFYVDHNQCCQRLDVKVEIFTVSGRLIKTLIAEMESDSYRIGPLAWDGLDEFGDRIGRGAYVYRVTVGNESGKKAEAYEKLVILR